MIFRTLVIASLACSLLSSEVLGVADKVIIKKSTRMLYLSFGGTIFNKYHVTLGQVTEGPKAFEGDMKTPEGVYSLDWRQDSAKFYKSIHLSYPNIKDKAHAKSFGKSAGGMIMIHGTPTNWSLSPLGDWMPMLTDWTEGCIAVTNDDIDEIWEQTNNGTPIVIIP